MAKTRPRPWRRPNQTQETERREAQRVLPGVCAWCLRSIPKRKPVIAVSAKFSDSRELGLAIADDFDVGDHHRFSRMASRTSANARSRSGLKSRYYGTRPGWLVRLKSDTTETL